MKTYTIIHEDHDIIVVNKHCGQAIESREDDLTKYLSKKKNIALHLITRLDQPVSGLVLYAKNRKAAARYSLRLQEGKIFKKYVAIVEGHVDPALTRVEHSLVKKGIKSLEDKDKGKKAVMHIVKNIPLKTFTKLEITIETGRFHQIRCQLGLIGHAVKGDLKYGSKRSNKEGGIYLHCHEMSWKEEEEEVLYQGPYPDDKPLYQIDN